ncbi:hypothetical protein SLE2022_106100 [Rubroshorea leprosula]
MEGSSKRKSTRRRRRRSHTRKVAGDCFINMAEARREILHALHLHRSSLSSSSTKPCEPAIILGGNNGSGSGVDVVSSYNCCYWVVEAMPLPEPVWSTTAPSVPAGPPVTEEAGVVEFEWGENQNQAASYKWWLGFLKALDRKSSEETKYPCLEDDIVFGEQENLEVGEPNFLSSGDQDSCLDDWLMFPATEDQVDNAVL